MNNREKKPLKCRPLNIVLLYYKTVNNRLTHSEHVSIKPIRLLYFTLTVSINVLLIPVTSGVVKKKTKMSFDISRR